MLAVTVDAEAATSVWHSRFVLLVLSLLTTFGGSSLMLVGVSYAADDAAVAGQDDDDMVPRPCGPALTRNEDTALTLVKPRLDFNGDGKTDILFRETSTRNLVAWYLDGLDVIGGAPLNPVRPAASNWSAVGEADFNGDGKPDIPWWNETSGNLAIWCLDGVTRTGGIRVIGIGDVHWQVAGTGDFNGDRKPDILWRDDRTGKLLVWYMDRTVHVGTAFIVPAGPLGGNIWSVVAIGDLNADGKPDLLFRHPVSGALVYWLLDGVVRTAGGYISPSPVPLDQRVAAIEDIDRDHHNDIVFQSQSTERISVWFMKGTTRIYEAPLNPAHPGPPGWLVTGPR